MRCGWLCVNAFVKTQKFTEIYTMIEKAAASKGIRLEIKTNARLLEMLWNGDELNADFAIFWDKDVNLAYMLELKGLRLFNRCEPIRLCDNKILTYAKLMDTGIRMPKTYVAPKTFLKTGFYDFDFLPHGIHFPAIVKEAFGSFGKQVFLVHGYTEMISVIKSFENRPFIIQEFISSSEGRDIRINVVGGKVAAAMLRYNNNDFRANITNGGNMKRYTPTSAEEELAIKASNCLGLDFGGVDILFGEGEPILCEVNSNAHFKNIYDCTGINVAENITEHIVKTVYGG